MAFATVHNSRTEQWTMPDVHIPNPKPRIRSALCIVNTPSGNGRSGKDRRHLLEGFHRYFITIHTQIFAETLTHRAVVQRTRAFLQETEGPWFLLSCGGSGTNRAILQGVMQAVYEQKLCLQDVHMAALRLGSGNIIPRLFGVATNPIAAMQAIADDLFTGRRQICAVYRISFPADRHLNQPLFGFTMAGIGQFGRVPRDVSRWRKQHPRWMQWATRRWGLEDVNTWQYLMATFTRIWKCLFYPHLVESIVITQNGRSHPYRLFAGMLLNFDFPQLPFRVNCDIGEPRLALALFPVNSRRQLLHTLLRWRQLDRFIEWVEVRPERPLNIHFVNQERTVLAVDEDTFIVPATLRLEVAGQIQFVTGTGK